MEISIKTVKISRTKNPRKDVKELKRVHKGLRQEYSTTTELHEKIIILDRINILKENITEKYKEGRSIRINHIAVKLKFGNLKENLKRNSRDHIP